MTDFSKTTDLSNLTDLYSECRLCPFECGVNRRLTQGRCREGDKVKIALAYPHLWEEPCLSGQGIEEPVKGSGTVFFVGCSLSCVFCQNSKISTDKTQNIGRAVSAEQLSEEFLRLQGLGVHNINLVTATHFVPDVIKAIEKARAKGLFIPTVYNSSGYELPKTLEMLNGYIDVYMPDFKYFSSRLSTLYSNAPNYREVAIKAISIMQKQTGEPEFDDKGFMVSGTLVRHLVLPGSDADSRKIISSLYDSFGTDGIALSVMNQYTPKASLPFPELTEKLPASAYLRVVEYAERLGIKYLYTQSGDTASESFIPDFK